MDRVRELDGLRAAAALLVIAWHYIGIPDGPSYWLWNVFYLGHFGVDLFFVLSGFLITSTLLKNRTSSSYFSSFYARRAFRIWPIYYLMVLTCAIGWASGRIPYLFDGALPGWTYLFGIQNFWMAKQQDFGAYWLGGTWSLAIEEQFYLVFPLIVRFVPMSVLPRLLLAIIFVCPLGRLFDSFTADKFGYYVLPQFRVDALAIGALIAWWRSSGARSEVVTTNVRRALIASTMLVPVTYLAGPTTFQAAAWQHTVVGVFFGAAVFMVLENQGASYLSPLRSGVARHLANWSYASYMIQHVVSFLVFAALGVHRTMTTPAGVLTTALALIATFALCALSYRYFEGPLLRYGHRNFSYSRRPPAMVAVPAE